jgi:biopolymer transport protein ExbD
MMDDNSNLTGGSNVMSEINVTPMVDVMLVLLIIFMVVTPTIMAGFAAQLPDGVNLLSRPDKDERVELGIDKDGRYYLNKTEIRRADAPALIQAEFEARPEDKVLFVKADKGLKYEELLTAMEIARDAGARVIAAITEQTPGTDPDDNR